MRRPPISALFPYTTLFRSLYFEGIYYGKSRFPLELCLQKKLTFDSPVYAKLRLINKKTCSEKEQDVYLFNVPNMTNRDRKSTRLNSSHPSSSYAVFCLKKK